MLSKANSFVENSLFTLLVFSSSVLRHCFCEIYFCIRRTAVLRLDDVGAQDQTGEKASFEAPSCTLDKTLIRLDLGTASPLCGVLEMSRVDFSGLLADMREAMSLSSECAIAERSTNAHKVRKSLENEGAVSSLLEASREWSKISLNEETVIKILSQSFSHQADTLGMHAEDARNIAVITKQMVMFSHKSLVLNDIYSLDYHTGLIADCPGEEQRKKHCLPLVGSQRSGLGSLWPGVRRDPAQAS